jgi:hypothetical protein
MPEKRTGGSTEKGSEGSLGHVDEDHETRKGGEEKGSEGKSLGHVGEDHETKKVGEAKGTTGEVRGTSDETRKERPTGSNDTRTERPTGDSTKDAKDAPHREDEGLNDKPAKEQKHHDDAPAEVTLTEEQEKFFKEHWAGELEHVENDAEREEMKKWMRDDLSKHWEEIKQDHVDWSLKENEKAFDEMVGHEGAW